MTVNRAIGCVLGVILLLAGAAGCTFFGNQGPPLENWEPQLSPDGSRLVYESPVEESLELFVRDMATGETRRITENDVEDWGPAWSPDGGCVVFASSRDDNLDVYVIDLDTGVETRLTVHEKDDINPSWGSDNVIYFNSNRTEQWEIFTIEPDGQNLARITTTAAAE